MANLFDPPAIVAESTAEMDQLAWEAKAAIEKAEQEIGKSIACYSSAGNALHQARAKCKRGQWLPWLDKQGIPRTSAYRAIKIWENREICHSAANLREALRFMADAKEEAEAVQQDTSKLVANGLLCKACRMAGKRVPTPGCKKCAERNKPDKPAPTGATTAPTGAASPPSPPEPAREPGDDPPEVDSPYISKAERQGKSQAKLADEVCRLREVIEADAVQLKKRVKYTAAMLKDMASKPPRTTPKKPSEGKCKYCGAKVLWGQSDNFKNIPLDLPQGGGGWGIDGRGFFVQLGVFDEGGYKSHFQTCTKRPAKGERK